MAKKKHVPIADDDESMVDVVAWRCETLGLRVERAYDGKSALDKVMAQEADLIVLDVNMPGGSGLSVCEMLSRDPYLRSIPVIILTGRKDDATVRLCDDLLAYYVPKGTNMWARLKPLIEKLLDLDAAGSVPSWQETLCFDDVVIASARGIRDEENRDPSLRPRVRPFVDSSLGR